jgi:Dolichyl-phosphate-mannose-protein mannosyltransferase
MGRRNTNRGARHGMPEGLLALILGFVALLLAMALPERRRQQTQPAGSGAKTNRSAARETAEAPGDHADQRFLPQSWTFSAALLPRRLAAFWPAALALIALTVFLALAVVLPANVSNVFNSPDETSNYTFTRTLAEHGRLWYTEDYLPLDQENLLHPRGSLTYRDRIVPFNYLGLPVLYAPLYRVMGDKLIYISLVFALVSAWALYRASNLLFGARAWEVWGALLSFTPLIYYLNRPYMNATPAMVFFFTGIWLFARYYRAKRVLDLTLASIGFALAMFMRYEYVLFLFPLAIWALAMTRSRRFDLVFFRDTAVFCCAVLTFFLVPVAILNRNVYGSWHTYGYSLFNQIYFPDRTSGSLTGGHLIRTIRGLFLPSYPFDFKQVLINVPRLTLLLAPVFTAVAAIGIGAGVARKSFRPLHALPIILLGVYMLVYRGSGNTWNVKSDIPPFSVAVVRYWLPFYALMFLVAVYGLSAIRDNALKLALVGALALIGTISVYYQNPDSLTTEASAARDLQGWGQNVLVPSTEPDALIYASRSDKRIVPYRSAATWWNGSEFYDAGKVSTSISRVALTGRPIYVYREREVDIPVLNEALAPFGLTTQEVGRTALFKVTPSKPNE